MNMLLVMVVVIVVSVFVVLSVVVEYVGCMVIVGSFVGMFSFGSILCVMKVVVFLMCSLVYCGFFVMVCVSIMFRFLV